MAAMVRVYIACSVDGFIAEEGGGVSFLERAQQDEGGNLPTPQKDGPGIEYEAFMADVGAMLMGRSTFDVVDGFDIPWPYGELPVLVATTRPLQAPTPQVRATKGSIEALIEEAKAAAKGKDVYLDGGQLIRQALDAGLIDELIVTMVPIILGKGIPLFAGMQQEHLLDFVEVHRWNQKCLQWVAQPRKQATP